MRRAIIVLSILAAAAVAAAVARPDPAISHPYVQWVGPDSKIDHADFQLIRDEAAWNTLWQSHTGKPPAPGTEGRHAAPKIDFAQCAIVACFRGRATNEDGEVLESILTTNDGLRLRFESSGFQTFGPGPDGGAVKTTPYGIWVIPATSKPIIVEEARRELKDEPVTWKEVKRFDSR